jgi:hypothetical protein
VSDQLDAFALCLFLVLVALVALVVLVLLVLLVLLVVLLVVLVGQRLSLGRGGPGARMKGSVALVLMSHILRPHHSNQMRRQRAAAWGRREVERQGKRDFVRQKLCVRVTERSNMIDDETG